MIEVLKQALDALESATPKYTRQRKDQKTLGGALDYWKLEQHQRLKAITALKEALAQHKEQEPVAWIQPNHLQQARRAPFLCRVEPTKRMSDFIPIYTTPQPQEFVCSTGLCHFTLTQTNVGIGERGMEAYEAAKKRGWVGVSDERLMEMPDEFVCPFCYDQGPAQRTWVDLSDEDIEECFTVTPDLYLKRHIAQRISAKLKEKNT